MLPFITPISIASASALLLASSVSAREISRSRAIAYPTPIAVEVGRGHTIDFSSMGEQVYKAWIGDGGRCLILSASSPLEDGAPVINLRRISPCQQVTGLPEVNQTTLTLITLSPDRRERIYVFDINYSATGDSLTRVVPGGATAARSTIAPSAVDDMRLRNASLDPAVVEEGLSTFHFEPDSQLALQVDAWIKAVRAGESQRAAAQSAGIDWAVLQRLERIGAQTSTLAEGSVGI